MVKTFLKYDPLPSLGLITSSQCKVNLTNQGKYALSPCLQDVLVWDLKLNELVFRYSDAKNHSKAQVSAIACNEEWVAIGYQDGTIRLFLPSSSSLPEMTFHGHTSAISVLQLSQSYLISGSKDTTIVVWDLLTQKGLTKLKGHKDQITQLAFLPTPQFKHRFLMSSSKDTSFKIWDIEFNAALATLYHQKEIWDFTFILNWNSTSKNTNSQEEGVKKKILPKDNEEDNKQEEENEEALLVLDGDHMNELKAYVFTPALLDQWLTPSFKNVFEVPPVSIPKLSPHRTVNLIYQQGWFFIASLDHRIELYQILDPLTAEKKGLKKLKKKKKLNAMKSVTSSVETSDLQSSSSLLTDETTTPTHPKDNDPSSHALNDSTNATCPILNRWVSCSPFLLPSKVRSLCVQENQCLISLHDNRLVHVSWLSKLKPYLLKHQTIPSLDLEMEGTWIEHAGHRGDIRCICVSSNGIIATAGSGQVKLWNQNQCSMTIDLAKVTSMIWVPNLNETYLLVGTKLGQLGLLNVHSGECMSLTSMHQSAIYQLLILPGGNGFVSCSADQHVQFYDFGYTATTTNTSFSSFSSSSSSGLHNDTSSPTLAYQLTKSLKLNDEVLGIAVSKTYLAVALLDCTVHVFYLDTLKFKFTLYGHKLPVLSVSISSDDALIVTGSADKSIKIWGTDFGDLHKSLFAHDEAVTCVRFIPQTHYVITSSKDHTLKFWDLDTSTLVDIFDKHQAEVWQFDLSFYGDQVYSCSSDRSIGRWSKTDHVFLPDELKEAEMDQAITQAFQSTFKETQEVVNVSLVDRWMEIMDQSFDLPTTTTTPATSSTLTTDLSKEHLFVSSLEKQSSDIESSILLLPFTYVVPFFHLVLRCEPSFLLCRFTFALLQLHQGALTQVSGFSNVLQQLNDKFKPWLLSTRTTMGRNKAACQFLIREKKELTTSIFNPTESS